MPGRRTAIDRCRIAINPRRKPPCIGRWQGFDIRQRARVGMISSKAKSQNDLPERPHAASDRLLLLAFTLPGPISGTNCSARSSLPTISGSITSRSCWSICSLKPVGCRFSSVTRCGSATAWSNCSVGATSGGCNFQFPAGAIALQRAAGRRPCDRGDRGRVTIPILSCAAPLQASGKTNSIWRMPQRWFGLADDCGLPGKALAGAVRNGRDRSEIYEQNRQDALSADVFGSPAYVLDGEVFWGQDRIELLVGRIEIGSCALSFAGLRGGHGSIAGRPGVPIPKFVSFFGATFRTSEIERTLANRLI